MKKNTIKGKNKTWDCSWTQYTHAYLFSFHPFSQTSPKLPSPVCLVLADSQLAQLFLENMRLKYTDMQTEEQGNEYTKRLHFLNPSLLNIQRPKTNSKACWNKSLFLSSSSYPSWVYSVTPRSMSTVTQSGIWSFMINSEQRKVVEMNWQRIFFFSKYFGYCYACCGMNKCWTLMLLFLKVTAKHFALLSLLISIIVCNTAQTKQKLAKHFYNIASPWHCACTF